MKIKIHQRKSDKNNAQLYKQAVEFFLNELLSKVNQDALTLSISFKKFRGKAVKEHADLEHLGRYTYKMQVNNLKPFHSIISTLAHECVHIKQSIKGQLVFKTNGLVYKNELYDVDSPSREEYNKLPHEVEARTLELDLTQRFFKSIVIPEVKTLNDV